MKAIINLYRQFYSIPKELPDHKIWPQIFIQIVFFFVLGFTVSQIIIFILQ